VVDGPVKTYPKPAKEPASTESDPGYSLNSCGSFAWLDHSSLSWKTYQRLLLGGWESFSGNWPAQGSMLNGAVYPQPAWERPTSAGGSSLWPTPTTSPTRPCEGNVRLLRTKVLVGDIPESEAMAMLNGKSPLEAQGKLSAADQAPSQDRHIGSLNPEWVEWLMGFPAGHTDLEP